MREISVGLSLSSQIGEVQSVVPVAGHCRAWRRARSSSLRIPLTMPGACPCPVAPVGSVVVAVVVRSAPC